MPKSGADKSSFKRWLFLTIVVQSLTLGLDLFAHPGHESSASDKQKNEKAIPDFFFDEADTTVDATVLDNSLRYDASIVSDGNALWYAWLEFTPGKGDQVWVGSRDDDKWQMRTLVTDKHGEYAKPTLTSDSRGRVWLSYEARKSDQWDVFVVRLDRGKPGGLPRCVSPGTGADIHHAVAADSDGGLQIVWQSDRDGQFDIVARRLTKGEPAPLEVVGEHSGGDWHPSIAITSDGKIHVAWDAYDGDKFNVHLRVKTGQQWGSVFDVARTDAFEGRAHLASSQRRVFLGWERGGQNWGKPYRGIKTELIKDHVGPLHRFRTLHVGTLKDEQPRLLEYMVPMPSIANAEKRTGRNPGVHRLGAFYERTKLCVDSAGNLWVFYRHYYTPWLGVSHRSHVEEGWGIYARYLTSDGWSKLHRMSVGQGDGMQRLELTPHGDGIAAVWTTGRTHRKSNKRPRGIVTAFIKADGQKPKSDGQIIQRTPLHEQAAKRGNDQPKSKSVKGGDQQFQLFYGDLHRHTDLSLCRVPIDGTIDDAYRYAIEVAKLDFLGITDHSRDIAKGNALSQLWWRSRKEVYRHQLGKPGQRSFLPFYAYERSHGNTADHNVISLRGDMLRPHTYPVPKFWEELDLDTMTIPHQPIRRDTWKYQNDRLRPLIEIFQGCRNASIEEHVHRGLAKGYHLGFIGSSDHMSTSASYACVWAKDASRESIFRAMQARRTFGATAKIRLTVKADDHWMGEIIKAERMPNITFEAQGTAPIRSVNVVVDGKTHESTSPNRKHVKLSRELDLTGTHYVYFHLVQSDGNEAWSSPLWFSIGDRDN